MKASKTSKQWMNEHVNDPYVQRAQKEGYRSRAAYKLLEIDERDHLIKPGMVVVDLGATPGGWCQVVAQKLGDKGRIIALDLLPLQPLPRVEFIQGDFREDSVLAQLEEKLEAVPQANKKLRRKAQGKFLRACVENSLTIRKIPFQLARWKDFARVLVRASRARSSGLPAWAKQRSAR